MDLTIKRQTGSGIWNYAMYCAYAVMAVGLFLCVPLLILFFYPDELSLAANFFRPGLWMVSGGLILLLICKRFNQKKGLERNQNIVVVNTIWIILALGSALPFYLSGDYTFSQSVFEVTSGLTTTGLTITNIEDVPHIFLFYRSLTNFIGGIGLILVMTAVLPEIYNMNVYSAEGHMDRMRPSLMSTARLVLMIYCGCIAAGAGLYICFGMNPFDAICHAMSAVSSGGFSTHPGDISYWNSYWIELVTLILMIISSISFVSLLYLLTGKIRRVLRHCETKFMAAILIITVLILSTLLRQTRGLSFWASIHTSIFHFFSAVSTTGYRAIDNFAEWNTSLILILSLLNLIGGFAGSAAGGLKMYRCALACKSLTGLVADQMSRKNSVHVVQVSRYGSKEPVSEEEQVSNFVFIFLFFGVFGLGVFLTTLYGFPLKEAVFEFSSALGNNGLSLGVIQPDSPASLLWIYTIGMMIGRLEVFTILFGAIRVVQDMKQNL